MKAVKWVLVVVGAVCLGIGLYMVVRLSMDMRTIMGAANAGKSVDVLQNPMKTVWIVGAVALIAGVLLGLGIGLPRRTIGSVRRRTLEGAAAQRENAIRENALRRSGRAQVDEGASEDAAELPAESSRPELGTAEGGEDQR
ncbi:hypothetical protein JS278_02282 [Acidipropionibacterium virtanenii]|uniref:Uncharacterized protein n=2 Tax=Acidipropionibacterium virtanenii TaxID=2057246 RepID=A0A344UVY6_9ACTN|nr:hypothetical protein JS278_02282 [Acidipropionibacterium virtanenii]